MARTRGGNGQSACLLRRSHADGNRLLPLLIRAVAQGSRDECRAQRRGACRGAREGGRASRCHSSSGIRLEMPWGRLAYVGARVESVDASPTESLPLVHSLPIASSMATCSRAGHLGERMSSVSKRVAASATAVDLVAGAAHRYLLESGEGRGGEGRGGEEEGRGGERRRIETRDRGGVGVP